MARHSSGGPPANSPSDRALRATIERPRIDPHDSPARRRPRAMCFDHDSRPPIPPIAGGALDAREIALDAADGNHFAAYLARAAEPTRRRDRDPARRPRPPRLLPRPRAPVRRERHRRHRHRLLRADGRDRRPRPGLRVPGARAPDDLRRPARRHRPPRPPTSGPRRAPTRLFTIGFCMGGRLVVPERRRSALGLAGVIGFYGWPVGPAATGRRRRPTSRATFESPVLAIFGGADEGIGPRWSTTFETALEGPACATRSSSTPTRRTRFFDRKADEFATTSAKAWDEILGFIRGGVAA